jgi:hypothetical protein
MTTRTEDWTQVADAVEALALKLKLHFESVAGDSAAAAKTAVDEVGDAVEKSFDALRNAVEDPAVKDDVKGVAMSLRSAVCNTLSSLRNEL